MRKLIRNILLVILLVSFLVIPAYSESNKVEHPIIIIAAGAPIPEYTHIFLLLLERAGIKADVLYDLNAQINSYAFRNTTFGKIESGKYKTAIFVFGTIISEYSLPDNLYRQDTKIKEVIEDLKSKVDLCKQSGVKMIGIQFYGGKNYFFEKTYTIKIIEEIVPYMDSLMVLLNSNDFPELGDRFIEVGKEKGIPIEYFTDSKTSFTSYAEVIPILSMKFGE